MAQTGNGFAQGLVIDGPGVSAATKNAWQAIEFNAGRRDTAGTFVVPPKTGDSQPPASPSIFIGTNPKVAVRANAINVATKLQQQIMTLPDG